MAKYFSNITEEEIEEFHAVIAKNVKRLRLANNQSLMDLSLDLGFRSGSFLGSAEACKNKKHFSIEHLYKLSKVFNVPIEEFCKVEK
ncbi:XRE family transcriptional regulator [Sulfurimonas sp.]|uniref:XRE family transcriptional regulator n=1 Tax=Sulfurimonas sp. TaxID=2022749 RepID=UPI002AB015E3|nr:XRE family transcriptional regulator [Sulfurimonas sp.]